MGLGTFTYEDLNHVLDRQGIAAALGFAPEKVVFVHGTKGSANNDGLARARPKATLAQALALVEATSGHVIYLMAGHTETLATAGVTWSTAGITVLGEGNGRSRPALTCGAANVVGLTISAANNKIKNVRFIGSTSQTTAASVILSLTSTDTVVENCVFEHGGAGPLNATLMNAAHRTVWKGCEFLGTAAGCDASIVLAASCNDCRFYDLVFDYNGSVGLDSCAIKANANDLSLPGGIIDNCRGVHMDIGLIDLNGSGIATTCDSLMSRCYAACGVASTAATALDLGSMALADCWWTDAQAASSLWCGAAIPPVAGTAGSKAAYPTAVPS